MTSKPPMLSVSEALTFLLDAVRPITSHEIVSTLTANGRVLAASQSSQIDVPPMDNTQMDGYAVLAADCANGDARLQVAQRIPAGTVGQPLVPGTAARIFTGAPNPKSSLVGHCG